MLFNTGRLSSGGRGMSTRNDQRVTSMLSGTETSKARAQDCAARDDSTTGWSFKSPKRIISLAILVLAFLGIVLALVERSPAQEESSSDVRAQKTKIKSFDDKIAS